MEGVEGREEVELRAVRERLERDSLTALVPSGGLHARRLARVRGELARVRGLRAAESIRDLSRVTLPRRTSRTGMRETQTKHEQKYPRGEARASCYWAAARPRSLEAAHTRCRVREVGAVGECSGRAGSGKCWKLFISRDKKKFVRNDLE